MPHGPAWPVPPVAVFAREIDEAVVLVVTGELGLRDVPLVRRALEKVLADRGRVLVDVSGMTVGWQPAVEVFPLALARTGGWPAARLVLFGARAGTATVLRSVGHLRSAVHLAEDEATAIALLGVRPQRLSRRAEMPCAPEAGWWARLLVRSAHEDWELAGPELATDLELVATELVANAVEHARTTSALTLTLAGSVLFLGVRDRDAASHPRVRIPEPAGPRGRGLAVVAGVARAWGATRHLDGKTVWALLPRSGRG